ncbi:MAG: hypothetical protein RIB80_04770 [Rhodospirillales bacterium]
MPKLILESMRETVRKFEDVDGTVTVSVVDQTDEPWVSLSDSNGGYIHITGRMLQRAARVLSEHAQVHEERRVAAAREVMGLA